MPDDNTEISADDWGAAMAEQTMVSPPAAKPAADDWGAAMAEQSTAKPAADDWGAAMAEQTAAPAAAAIAQPHVFEQLGAGSVLKVISGVAVGQRERIVLVEVNDTWLVIGVAPGQVRTLHSMPKSNLPIPQAETPPGMDGKFQGWLKQMMDKRNAGK